MNSKVYKWCAVPQCKNTSIKTPNKLFVYVPNKKTIRDKWLKLARRNPNDVVTNSSIYFCEDHFDVRATELIRSKDFGTAYTLRFPRITKIRTDKPVQDIMTLQEFDQLASSKAPVVKLSSKRVNADQIADTAMKVPRKQRSTIQVAERFRTKAVGDVHVTSQALSGRKLCVLSEDPDCNKAELIRIIETHGGKHVQNVGEDTWTAVAGKLTEKVKILQAQQIDIISTDWLRNLPQSEMLCELSPLDMLSMKQSTKLALSLQYDSFGDSYAEPTDEATLRKCFEKMEKNEPPIYLIKKEMLHVDKELFGDTNTFSFLRPCTILVKKQLYALLAKMYGASVTNMANINVTHLITSKETEPQDIEEIREKIPSALIVSEKWLEACFSAKKIGF